MQSHTLLWLSPSAWDQLTIQGSSSTRIGPTLSLVTRPDTPSINEAHAPSTCAQGTGTDDNKRCTVALTVSASGKMLTAMVIYKGTRHGCIATRELHDHPPKMKYAMQPKAWFDETTMLDWVDEVLKPYVATASVRIIPILFLDSFKVRLLGSVANAIQGLGAELKIIPPGCTGLVNPTDVGINKPFKANMRKIYTEWLLKQDADTAIPSASCLDVSAFILEAVKSIKKETIVNSWRKTGFSYFE
jgi:hypothetical protein